MKKYIKQILKIAVSVLLISILFYKVGFKEVYKNLLTINPFYLILMIIVFLMSFLIASISIKVLLLPLKARRLGLKKLVWYNMLTYAISRFIPGRVGDLSMVYFLKKEDMAVGRASAIVLMDRIIVFFVHFILACFGFFIFFPSIVAVKLTCISILIFAVLIFYNMEKRKRHCQKIRLKKTFKHVCWILQNILKLFQAFQASVIHKYNPCPCKNIFLWPYDLSCILCCQPASKYQHINNNDNCLNNRDSFTHSNNHFRVRSKRNFCCFYVF